MENINVENDIVEVSLTEIASADRASVVKECVEGTTVCVEVTKEAIS
jgi:hypothetical protein